MYRIPAIKRTFETFHYGQLTAYFAIPLSNHDWYPDTDNTKSK